jgi:hypothetical protein
MTWEGVPFLLYGYSLSNILIWMIEDAAEFW